VTAEKYDEVRMNGEMKFYKNGNIFCSMSGGWKILKGRCLRKLDACKMRWCWKS
jgi:hypothetical protein